MRLMTWNVNGLRAAVRKGFWDWMEDHGAEVVGLQEVRARREQLDALRNGLRHRVATSLLTDAAAYAADFERNLQRIWEQYLAGLAE